MAKRKIKATDFNWDEAIALRPNVPIKMKLTAEYTGTPATLKKHLSGYFPPKLEPTEYVEGIMYRRASGKVMVEDGEGRRPKFVKAAEFDWNAAIAENARVKVVRAFKYAGGARRLFEMFARKFSSAGVEEYVPGCTVQRGTMKVIVEE